MKKNDSLSVQSLNLLFDELLEKNDFAGAERVTSKFIALYGQSINVLNKQISISYKKSDQKTLIELIETGYKKYPDYFLYTQLKANVEKSINKNFVATISLYKKYVNKHYSLDAVAKLADAYIEINNYKTPIELYEKYIKNEQTSVGMYNSLANLYYEIKDYDKAIYYLKEALNLAPYVSVYYASLGKILKQTGDREGMLENFRKAIYYNPTDYDTRRLLRTEERKPEALSYFKEEDVNELYKKAPDASKYPDHNYIYLLDEIQKVFYGQGAAEERVHFLIKVLNEKGVEACKEDNISVYGNEKGTLEKAEVIKKNGQVIKAENESGHLVFTNLEVGDAINVIYKKEIYNSGKLAPYFWNKFTLAGTVPTLLSRFSFLVSPDTKFDYKITNGTIKPKIEKKDEFNLYVFESLSDTVIKTEANMPTLTDVLPVLYISSIPNWNFISQWYQDLSFTKTNPDDEIKEAVAELFKNKKNLTEYQKAKMIYEFIEKNIKYSSVSFRQSGLIPQKASKTLRTKLGDCKDNSSLFVSMAQEAGLKAQLILVNTRNNGINDPYLPSIDFNHCMANVKINNQDYILELTDNLLPFNCLLNNELNSNILKIRCDWDTANHKLEALNPPTRNKNIVIRSQELNVGEKDITVSRISTRIGGPTIYSRQDFKDKSPKQMEDYFIDVIKGDFNSTKLISHKVLGIETLTDTTKTIYKFLGTNAVKQIGDLKLFKIPWFTSATESDLGDIENRKFPIEVDNIASNDELSEEMTIIIPDGKVVVDMPKPMVLTCKYATYKMTMKKDIKNKYYFTRRIDYSVKQIPVDGIKEYENFYRQIIENDSKEFAFKSIQK